MAAIGIPSLLAVPVVFMATIWITLLPVALNRSSTGRRIDVYAMSTFATILCVAASLSALGLGAPLASYWLGVVAMSAATSSLSMGVFSVSDARVLRIVLGLQLGAIAAFATLYFTGRQALAPAILVPVSAGVLYVYREKHV